jgi:uncharacterized membrane protein
LPPPETLASYNNAFAGCAERIVALAEEQARHRQSIERRVIDAGIKNEKRGQLFAFILLALALGGGIFLIYSDKDAVGLATVLGALVTPIGLLILGRWRREGELLKKWRELLDVGKEKEKRK